MLRFIVRRLALLVPVLLGLSLLLFIWVRALPGDPARARLGERATPEGLLAVGGDLRPERLLEAYRHGIFPWYNDDQPILWWSPDPRMVFRTDSVRLSTRFRRQLRGSRWTLGV